MQNLCVFWLFFSKITFYLKLFSYCFDKFDYPGSIVYLSCFTKFRPCHISIYWPLLHAKFYKDLIMASYRTLMDGQKDRRTDETDYIEPAFNWAGPKMVINVHFKRSIKNTNITNCIRDVTMVKNKSWVVLLHLFYNIVRCSICSRRLMVRVLRNSMITEGKELIWSCISSWQGRSEVMDFTHILKKTIMQRTPGVNNINKIIIKRLSKEKDMLLSRSLNTLPSIKLDK